MNLNTILLLCAILFLIAYTGFKIYKKMSQKPKLGGKFEEDASSVAEDISDKLGDVVNKVPHVVVFNSKGIRRESDENEESEEYEEYEELSEEEIEETIAEISEGGTQEATHEATHEATNEEAHEATHEATQEDTHEEAHEATQEAVYEEASTQEDTHGYVENDLDIKIIETLNLDSFTLDELQAMTVTNLRCILKDQGVSIPKSIRKNALVQKVYELRNN
jgi:antirestriction protein